MGRFLRSKAQRNALYIAADGKCQGCGCELPDDWHADHVVPWSATGDTNVHAMRALCPPCNLRKGNIVLRKHQLELLNILQQSTREQLVSKRSIVAHVWPGGGKSALPVIAGHVLMKKGIVEKIVVIVPRLTLKRQGAEAFLDPMFRNALGHALEIREAGNDVNPDRGTAGYITTYDSVREQPSLHADFFRLHRCLLVIDEVHHVAEGSETHRALEPLYALAAFRLPMTGTADRNEGGRIAFLDYAAPELGGKLEPEAEIRYGLKDAIREQSVIPIEFHHVDGQVTFMDKTGQYVWLGTLANDGDDCRDGVHAALRTEYANQLLTRCVDHWRRWRLAHQRSLLLVVCFSIRQANAVNAQLSGMGIESQVATSDDPQAALEAIKRFRKHGTPPVLVTVMMAYEGMDVKGITHVACLTHIRSFPWLMQMFGRATRYDPEAGPWDTQKAFVFAPDDALMQKAIEYVRREQVIGIREQEPETKDPGSGDKPASESAAQLHPGVVPIDGTVTRERASGLLAEQDLGYAETMKLKGLMDKHNISGSVIDLAALLRDEFKVDIATTPQEPPPRPAPSNTAGDREKALRDSIENLLRRLDRHTGSAFGTWNQKCFREIQRCKPRDQLREDQLRSVWRWCCEQAGRMGLESNES